MNWHNVLLRPQNLYEELLRRKLISGGGVPAVLQTVTGISPLNIMKIASRGIKSLIQFGKCEQASTPTPSVPVDIKCNNGIFKVRRKSGVPLRYQPVEYLVCNKLIEFSGHKTTQKTEMRAKVYIPSSLTAQYLWRSDSSPSSTTNTTAYMLTTGGQLRFGDTTILYYATEGEIEIKQNRNGVWINGESIGTYTDISAFQSTAPIGIFSNVTSPNMRIYWVQKYDNGVLDLDLVPVLDTANNKYGWYDRVGESFYTSNVSGTSFTAGAVINDVEYYVDGTPEVLTICGKNIYNKNYTASEINAFINSTNNTLIQGTTQYVYVLPCKPNTTYTASGMGERTSRWGSFTSKALGTVATAYASGNGTITTGANDKYIIGLISAQSQSGDIDFHDTLQIEVGSTATDYEAYSEQTASVADLFAVGDDKDEQDIVSGLLTHRVGIKVFDGTENWREATHKGVFFTSANMGTIETTRSILCNAFSYSGAANANMSNYTGKLANTSAFGGAFHFVYDEYANDVDGFTAWLAAQYANGTPVVVVYPLAEPTTEQVTGQHLSARDTATITAVTNNISDVTLEVQYWEKAE